jgi:dTDP-L-rhamnose 4-epimerase
VAVAVVVALALTFGFARTAVSAWWVLPATVAILLPLCRRRSSGERRRSISFSASSSLSSPFIGSHVVDRLVAEGHEPVVLDALIPQAHGRLKPTWVGELVHAGVRDEDALRPVLRGVDAVCHQAAMVGHGVDAADAPAYAGHKNLGTALLLAAMYAAGFPARAGRVDGRLRGGSVRVQRARRRSARAARARRSAAGRFEPLCPLCGRDLAPGLVLEDAPLDPRSTYAATKLAQEHLAGARGAADRGAEWSLRYHNVYGPRMPRDTPYAGGASVSGPRWIAASRRG